MCVHRLKKKRRKKYTGNYPPGFHPNTYAHKQMHTPRHQLPCYFLSSHSSSCLLTLIHWLCRSPSPQVTITESPMSRFVTVLWSDHCCPMGSGLEYDIQLGALRTSGSMPCPWVSFCLHTHITCVFLSFGTKLCLFYFILLLQQRHSAFFFILHSVEGI